MRVWKFVKLKYLSQVQFSSVDRKTSTDEINVRICHYPQAYKNEFITNTTSLSSGTCSQNEYDNYSLKRGQIILTKDSESADDIGIPAYVKEDIDNAVCGYHLAMIETDGELDPEFLFRYLQSSEVMAYYEQNSNGVTRFGLGKPTIESLRIPIPEIEEQLRVASFLNHKTTIIDELIQKNERLLVLLAEQRKAIINEAVTKGLDPNAKMKDSGVDWIGEIPKNWGSIKLRRLFNINKRIAGTLGYDVLSVTQNGLKVKDLVNLQGQHSMDYTKYQIVEPGDFVMNHMDLLTGYVDLSDQLGVTSPDYRVFTKQTESVHNDFYLFIFQLCYKRKIFYGLGRGVSDMGRWRLPANEFNDFKLPMPPFDEQVEIANYLHDKTSTINKIIDSLIILNKKLTELRLSLISEAVTGKIDLREWSSEQKATG